MDISVIVYEKNKDLNITEISEKISAQANDGYELYKTFEDKKIYVLYFRAIE